ncbi:MAG: TIGR04219 family outer membrane beta-barrel protein [Ketobacter sp.]|nr:MAG: TIGR04219 family outer membrane beta-barrel protein [Ketobacter sp.]
MKKMTTTGILGLGLALSPPSYSDTLFGIYAGGGSINYDLSGDFTDLNQAGASSVDLEQNLGLSGDRGNYIYIALEHGIPILPNIKLAHSDIQESATNTLSENISFGGTTFPIGSIIATNIDFSHTDLTLYYEILDNWISLDAGFTIRTFDGELSAFGRHPLLPGISLNANEDLDFTAPLLYGKARFDLPVTGLYLGAEVNWIGIGDAQLYDAWAHVGYVFGFGLGLEAGMRNLGMELDDVEDLDADIDLKGTYIAATFHF